MIQIVKLKKGFKSKTVLDNLNLTVRSGSMCGIVGENGAGKSTLLRILAGVYKADSGSIIVDGEELKDNEKIKSKFFYVADEPYYSFNMTGKDLCDMYKAAYDFEKSNFMELLSEFKLNLNEPIRNYSKGMRRRLFICLALAIKPQYLLLDEAFDGLDPLSRRMVNQKLIELVEKKNSTVLVASHSLRELEDICDSYVILGDKGVKDDGDISKLSDDYHKYQLGFKELDEDKVLISEAVYYEKNGRVVTVVLKGGEDECRKRLEKLNPLFIDELPITLEEYYTMVTKDDKAGRGGNEK